MFDPSFADGNSQHKLRRLLSVKLQKYNLLQRYVTKRRK